MIQNFRFLDWPLGEKDIKVDLLFHMVSCSIPDLSIAVPAPEFVCFRFILFPKQLSISLIVS